MDIAGQPDQVQNWFSQFAFLQNTAEFWSQLCGYSVTPFRSLVFDLIAVVIGFYILVFGLWIIQRVRHHRYRADKYQF